jgi:chromatin remodeling complex protein RSC6
MATKKTSTPAFKTVVAATVAAKVISQEMSDTPTVTPLVEEPVVSDVAIVTVTHSDDLVDTKFQSMYTKLAIVSNAVKELSAALKAIQKEYSKTIKTAAKRGRKASIGKRSPSGFAKPAILSDELCDFLKIDHKSERARTEVTRMINDYIKSNKLQDPEDKRKIVADESLKKIMNLKDTDELSYFNLQKFIKHHFIPTPPVVPVIAVPVIAVPDVA